MFFAWLLAPLLVCAVRAHTHTHTHTHAMCIHVAGAQGPVIKFNSNQRYATNAVTALVLRRIAEIADVPLQVRSFVG